MDLFVQLSYTARQCVRPGTVQKFKSIGVRNPAKVVQNLMREYARLHKMASVGGFTLHHQDEFCSLYEPSSDHEVERDFHALAEAYQLLALAMELEGRDRLASWLRGRVRVHFARASGIREGFFK